MKKIVIVGILIFALVISLSTAVKAADDIIDIEDFGTIDEVPNSNAGKPTTNTNQSTNNNQQPENSTTETEKGDGSESDKPNPQTGIKEEAPIIILTIIGVGVAIYAGAKIKKYNY